MASYNRLVAGLFSLALCAPLLACGSSGGTAPVKTGTTAVSDTQDMPESNQPESESDEVTAEDVRKEVLARLQDMRDYQLLDPLTVDPKLEEAAKRLAPKTSSKYGGKSVLELRDEVRTTLTKETGYGTLAIEARASAKPKTIELPTTVTSPKMGRVGVGVHKHPLESGHIIWKVLILMSSPQ